MQCLQKWHTYRHGVFLNHLRTEQADNASLRRQNLGPAITELQGFFVYPWQTLPQMPTV